MWGSRGLKNVFQRDNHTFVLKFDNEQCRDVVLSRGTWYVGRRPMVVTGWGVQPGKDCVETLPLWIKLSNIPDYYWTDEGLSRLASVVGKPLGADALTSKLEMLPFAKLQVVYKLGDPLPNEISAVSIDPVSQQKSVVKVSVSYPFRPLFCSGCKSLGHSIGACPKVARVWVQKSPSSVMKVPVDKANPVPNNEATGGDVGLEKGSISETPSGVHQDATLGPEQNLGTDDRWVEVKRKKGSSPGPECSPSPPRTFKNLRVVDEIDRRRGAGLQIGTPSRLTKSQKKKLRLQKGGSPPTSG